MKIPSARDEIQR
ncbi:hypothetical protein V6N13_053670 [Hibiscus sabdariffa]